MKMFRHLLFLGTMSLSLIGATTSSHATIREYILATCGSPCQNALYEELNAKAMWASLKEMGDVSYIGAQISGVTIDASSLLAAARVAGVGTLDTFLKTGYTPDEATYKEIVKNLTTVRGINISGITGITTSGVSSDGNTDTIDTADTSTTTTSSGGVTSLISSLDTAAATLFNEVSLNGLSSTSSATTGGCATTVGEALSATAKQTVENMTNLSTSDQYGFSKGSGFYGSTCADTLLNGTRDLLFKPPQLSSLLSMLQNMFNLSGSTGSSGGSGGICGNAPSILQQVTGSNPTSLFSSGMINGFLPYLNQGSGGLADSGSTNVIGVFTTLAAAQKPTTYSSGFSTIFK